MRSTALFLLPVVALVACASDPNEEATSSDEASLISCRDRRPAHPAVVPGTYWQKVVLPVSQGRQGITSISRMMNTADGGEFGFQALMKAKQAAVDDLVSVDSLLRYLAGPGGTAPPASAFRADGTYVGPRAITIEWRDLEYASWLIANIFTRVTRGIDVGSALAWDKAAHPIDGLVAKLRGESTGYCQATGAELAVGITRESDLDHDAKLSMVEAQRWFEEKYGVTVRIDETSSVSASGTLSDEGSRRLTGLSCLKQVFRAVNPTPPPPSDTVALCGTIDLMANQGRGVTFTGTTVSTSIGAPPAYEIVMLSGRLVGPNAKRLLCVRDDDELKLFVPYRQREVSECGLVNGVYRAAYYRLDPRVWQDNWAP